MTNEFDERLFDDLSETRSREEDVNEGEDGKHGADCQRQRHFVHHVATPETRKTLVPKKTKRRYFVSKSILSNDGDAVNFLRYNGIRPDES